MAYVDLLNSKLTDLSTTAGNAVADLAGVQSGADVLASQFTDVKNALQDLQDFVNEFKTGYYYTPTGVVVPFAGAATDRPPTGWYLCNGDTWATLTLSAGNPLYDLLQSQGWLGVPDLRGKTVIGVQTGTYDLKTAHGAATRALAATNLPTHTHSWSTTSTGGHEHTYGINAQTASAGGTSAPNLLRFADTNATLGNTTGGTGGGGAHSHSGTTGDGTGTFNATPIDMLQPSLALNYIIKG